MDQVQSLILLPNKLMEVLAGEDSGSVTTPKAAHHAYGTGQWTSSSQQVFDCELPSKQTEPQGKHRRQSGAAGISSKGTLPAYLHEISQLIC